MLAPPGPPLEEGIRVIRPGRTAHDDDERQDTAEQPPLFSTLDTDGDERLEALLEGDHDAGPAPRERERGRPRMPRLDDIPSGRVPDDVLRRFEDAIAREERRRAQHPRGGSDD